jgi:prepilin-type processing-associated H-X9-DG protein
VFVEQADPRGYNEGTFVIAADTQNGKITFEDVFAIYHGDVGTFAFADGHAIGHRWLDKGIITDGLYSVELGSSGDDYNNCAAVTGVSPSQTGPDASFIIQSFESPTDP